MCTSLPKAWLEHPNKNRPYHNNARLRFLFSFDQSDLNNLKKYIILLYNMCWHEPLFFFTLQPTFFFVISSGDTG